MQKFSHRSENSEKQVRQHRLGVLHLEKSLLSIWLSMPVRLDCMSSIELREERLCSLRGYTRFCFHGLQSKISDFMRAWARPICSS